VNLIKIDTPPARTWDARDGIAPCCGATAPVAEAAATASPKASAGQARLLHNSSADYADLRRFGKTEPRRNCGAARACPAEALAKAGRLPASATGAVAPHTERSVTRVPCTRRWRVSILDQFTSLMKSGTVDRLAGFELRRLGDITGGIAAADLPVTRRPLDLQTQAVPPGRPCPPHKGPAQKGSPRGTHWPHRLDFRPV